MFVCEKENLDKAYRGDLFMEKVIKTAKEIAGREKIPLYLSEPEIRRLDREEAVEEGEKIGILKGIKQNRTEMIINMYNKNIDINTIAEVSNLSLKEVKQIINNNKKSN